MVIDYKQKYFDLKDKEEAQLHQKVDGLVEDVGAIKDNVKALADHVATQNGRVGKLEKIVGRKINFNDPTVLKTARIIFICVAIIVVVILTGGDGLGKLVDWLPNGG